jgi:hypothetical protein
VLSADKPLFADIAEVFKIILDDKKTFDDNSKKEKTV